MQIYIIIICIITIYILFKLNYKHYKQELFNNSNKKIIICMSYTENISSYSKYAEIINKKYAKQHNYSFKKFNIEMTDRAQQWCKIKVINELLNTNQYDYIFWIDSDAFFNNFNITLNSIIDKYSDKDIIICDDIPNSGKQNTINTGTMFIKCTDWNKKFCKDWYNYTGDLLYNPLHEQGVLENFINDNKDNCKNHIQICPTNMFNSTSSEYNDSDYKKHNDFISHLMARDTQYRINYMKNWINNHPELDIQI